MHAATCFELGTVRRGRGGGRGEGRGAKRGGEQEKGTTRTRRKEEREGKARSSELTQSDVSLAALLEWQRTWHNHGRCALGAPAAASETLPAPSPSQHGGCSRGAAEAQETRSTAAGSPNHRAAWTSAAEPPAKQASTTPPARGATHAPLCGLSPGRALDSCIRAFVHSCMGNARIRLLRDGAAVVRVSLFPCTTAQRGAAAAVGVLAWTGRCVPSPQGRDGADVRKEARHASSKGHGTQRRHRASS